MPWRKFCGDIRSKAIRRLSETSPASHSNHGTSISASAAIHICAVEIGLHAGPTDARGFFGSAAALPVRFEIDRIGVANLRECAKLGGPIDVALVDGRPLRLTSAVLDGVLDVAVVDAVFGQSVPAAGIGVEFAAHDGIARVPVKRKIA